MGIVLPSYPIVQPPAWCAAYIGIPWELGARSREKIDCWGLNWLVLTEQFGKAAPSYEGIEWTRSDSESRRDAGAAILAKAAEDFISIDAGHEEPGDTIILRIGRYPLHCGIVVAPGWMLHAAEDAETALERYDNLVWRHRVEGLWRLTR